MNKLMKVVRVELDTDGNASVHFQAIGADGKPDYGTYAVVRMAVRLQDLMYTLGVTYAMDLTPTAWIGNGNRIDALTEQVKAKLEAAEESDSASTYRMVKEQHANRPEASYGKAVNEGLERRG